MGARHSSESQSAQQTLHAHVRKRVTVVGGGAIGTCCAMSLQRAGHHVTLVEPVAPGHRASSSWGNAGLIASYERRSMLSPSFLTGLPSLLMDPKGPVAVKFLFPYTLTNTLPWVVRLFGNCLSQDTHERLSAGLTALNGNADACWEDLVSELPAAERAELYVRSGTLLCSNEALWDGFRTACDRRSAGGAALRMLDGRQLRESDRLFTTGGAFAAAAGGAEFIAAAHITDTQRLFKALVREFRQKHGGSVVHGRVVALNGTECVVEDADGASEVVSGDVVVLACGAQALNVLPALGEARVPLEVERGYSIAFDTPGDAPVARPVGWFPARFYFTPMAHGLRAAGMAEFGNGFAPATPERLDAMEARAREQIPTLPPRNKEYDWVGHRPSTPDLLPVISWSDRNPDVIHAYGHGHFGITQAAVTGRLVTDMVSEREPLVDLAPYRIDRFDWF